MTNDIDAPTAAHLPQLLGHLRSELTKYLHDEDEHEGAIRRLEELDQSFS